MALVNKLLEIYDQINSTAMKISPVLSITLIIPFSCTEDLSLAPNAQNRTFNANSSTALAVSPAGDLVWTLMPMYNDADGATCQTDVNEPTQELSFCKAIEINGEIYGFGGGGYYEVQRKLNKTTKQWETFSQTTSVSMKTALQRTNYLFSYGNKMYTGLWSEAKIGWYPGIVYSVNHVTGILSEVAPFPGVGTIGFISFAVGNKGYVMGGYTIDTYIMSEQFWEYNFDTNVWTNKGTIPGGVRAGASVFVIDGNVYVGMGYSSLDNDYNNDYHRVYRRDWIKFSPADPTSVTTLQSFPGTRRYNAYGFALNNKIYLTGGYGRTIGGAQESTDDFWEYNPATNVWKEKTKCPNNMQVKFNRAAFVQGNAGYLIIGCLTKLWRYSNTSAVPTPPVTGSAPVSTNQ
jgi:hypothetical protein